MGNEWETIYAAGEQLNRYPYSEVVAFVKRRWRSAPKDFLALDVGCGSGVHAGFLATEGMQVTAFDGSSSAVEHAQKLFPDPLINYRVASFADFDPGDEQYDLVIDRLSSTTGGLDEVEALYQRLRPHLKSGAQVFWQGFDTENSGRAFGRFDPARKCWDSFSAGVFQHLGPTSFFAEEDLNRIFAGYIVTRRRLTSDTDLDSGYRHSFWTLELSAP